MTVEPDEHDDLLRMLAEAVADFAPPDAVAVRRHRDACAGFAREDWPGVAAMGWLHALQPGAELPGEAALAVVAEGLAHGARQIPFTAAAMALAALQQAAADGAPATADEAAQLLDGRRLLGLAWSADHGEPLSLGARWQRRGHGAASGGVLSGACRHVALPQADAFLVAARHGADGTTGLVRVARDAPGLRLEAEAAVDGTRLGRLVFAGVEIAEADVLAEGDAACRALAEAFELGAMLTAAELVGLSRRALALTLEHLKTRQQFGQPIGAFQVLQHRAVDMWLQVELARAALRAALRRRADPAADDDTRRAAASSAKARASKTALHVCGQAVQLHGAIGFTDEHELGLHVNRALVLAARCGNEAWHRRRHGTLVPIEER